MKLPTLNKDRVKSGFQVYLAMLIILLAEIVTGYLQPGSISRPGVWAGFAAFLIAGPLFIVYVHAKEPTEHR